MTFEDKTTILRKSDVKAAQAKRPRAACFIVIAGSQAGRMYKLERDEMIIGRVAEAGIRIEDDGVSRRHAQIVRDADGTVRLADLESTNGTFLNGERVQAQALKDGDKIQIGTTTILKFSFQDTLEEDFLRRQYESATRDSLTNCFNKKYLQERLPSELAFAKRHNKALSIAMIVIDHFKQVNDTHGHQAGDAVLQGVAKVIADTIRVDDLLARYGGEEFVLLMRETSQENAFAAVERVRRQIELASFPFADQSIKVTVSIGVASWADNHPDTTEAMIGRADEYLYKAKHNGRNRSEGSAVA